MTASATYSENVLRHPDLYGSIPGTNVTRLRDGERRASGTQQSGDGRGEASGTQQSRDDGSETLGMQRS